MADEHQSSEVKRLFDEAADLDPSQRTAYLDAQCSDAGVRSEVESLLRYHDKQRGPLSEAVPPELVREAVQESETVVMQGFELGPYHVIRQLGSGAMGVVYLAHQRTDRLDRMVALKLLETSDPGRIERFFNEARIGSRLETHRNIVTVYDAGEVDGRHYIALEFVFGATLAHRLRSLAQRERDEHRPHISDRAELRRLVGFIADIADGLEHAHRRGVVHRDVKPSNILLDEHDEDESNHVAKLADFGIAIDDLAARETMTGQFVGTYVYMSPERVHMIKAADLDGRADVYSLGVVLYEVLTGRLPFDVQGRTREELLTDIISREPDRARQVNRTAPRDLATIAHKAMEKNRARRYSSAQAMGADLRNWIAGRPIMARPVGPLRRAGRWARAHRGQAIAASFVVLVGVIAGLVRYQRTQWQAARCGIELISDARGEGATVYLREFGPVMYEPLDERTAIGVMPLTGMWLEPGRYRFEIVADNGRFEEVDVWLQERGETTRIEFMFRGGVGVDYSDMVEVPAGEHVISNLNGSADAPDHVVSVDAFLIDRHEVTNAEFARFVRATNLVLEEGCDVLKLADDPRWSNYPATGMNWDDANAYALWMNKRLPTLAEWEAAARYPDGRLYPWGNDPDAPDDDAWPITAEHFCMTVNPKDSWKAGYDMYRALAAPVDTDPLPSALDLTHMYGNAEEWLGSVVPHEGPLFKGGSWLLSPNCFDLRGNKTFPRRGVNPRRGFRCSRSVGTATGR